MTEDVVSKLESIIEDLMASVDELEQLSRSMPSSTRGRMEAYTLPWLKIWIGASESSSRQIGNLAGILEELQEEGYSGEGDDYDEEDDEY